jgi:MoxR-like ATPase
MGIKPGSPYQSASEPGPISLASLDAALKARGHFAQASVLSTLRLALQLKKPLLLDGPSGSGKTHLAESYAKSLGITPIRLIIHADTQREDAAYDWNYSRQLLGLRLMNRQGQRGGDHSGPCSPPWPQQRLDITPPMPLLDEQHLIAKPLLQAIRASQPGRPAVLILEGLDQSDASLDGVLLPFLDDYQLTIDGLGCLRAQHPPVIFITSREARRLSDPVRRRAIYQYCALPDAARERRIIEAALPGAGERLSQAVIDFVRGLRISDLAQRPGMDQLIAWTKTLRQLDALSLDPELIQNTLGLLLKHQHALKPLAGSDASAWLAALQARAQDDSVIGLSS